MKLIQLPNTHLSVSNFCYGGGPLGTSLKGKAMDKFLRVFRDAGGNFLDTAHCYACWVPGGVGLSELAIGDYVKRNGGKGMVIATKGGHPGVPGYRSVDRYLSKGRIEADIDDSLARLGFDTIDLYWLHRDDPRMTVAEIIETLNGEVKRGRIRYLGASNWTTARIAEANEYARAHRLRGFAATQPEWSLAKPNAEWRKGSRGHFHSDADVAWCGQQGFPVLPYTPTAGGYFATEWARRQKRVLITPRVKARLKRATKSLASELRVEKTRRTRSPWPSC